ncbi:hypothetical protein BB559_000200 [Furculomyces boomerangus]|uniref:Uncharacterized protein n=1 Tax=Furculomyces boomerangus TaxID=61424 RepID=A0A2T9Z5V9_9FUNG|nr:hypothetical protein BB559_000200 [Furculomyces boomerangus]
MEDSENILDKDPNAEIPNNLLSELTQAASVFYSSSNYIPDELHSKAFLSFIKCGNINITYLDYVKSNLKKFAKRARHLLAMSKKNEIIEMEERKNKIDLLERIIKTMNDEEIDEEKEPEGPLNIKNVKVSTYKVGYDNYKSAASKGKSKNATPESYLGHEITFTDNELRKKILELKYDSTLVDPFSIKKRFNLKSSNFIPKLNLDSMDELLSVKIPLKNSINKKNDSQIKHPSKTEIDRQFYPEDAKYSSLTDELTNVHDISKSNATQSTLSSPKSNISEESIDQEEDDFLMMFYTEYDDYEATIMQERQHRLIYGASTDPLYEILNPGDTGNSKELDKDIQPSGFVDIDYGVKMYLSKHILMEEIFLNEKMYEVIARVVYDWLNFLSRNTNYLPNIMNSGSEHSEEFDEEINKNVFGYGKNTKESFLESLNNALESAKLAKEQIPLVSKLSQQLPGKFSQKCIDLYLNKPKISIIKGNNAGMVKDEKLGFEKGIDLNFEEYEIFKKKFKYNPNIHPEIQNKNEDGGFFDENTLEISWSLPTDIKVNKIIDKYTITAEIFDRSKGSLGNSNQLTTDETDTNTNDSSTPTDSFSDDEEDNINKIGEFELVLGKEVVECIIPGFIIEGTLHKLSNGTFFISDVTAVWPSFTMLDDDDFYTFTFVKSSSDGSDS